MMCSPLVADPYFSDQAAKAQAITRPTAAYTSRRAAPGGLQFPRPGGDPASTCTTWLAIAEQLAPEAAAPPGAAPRDPEEGESLQSIAVHDALKITHERFGLALAP